MSESEQELLNDGNIRITLVEEYPLPGKSGDSTRTVRIQALDGNVNAAENMAKDIIAKTGERANSSAVNVTQDKAGFSLSVRTPDSNSKDYAKTSEGEAQLLNDKDVYRELKQAAIQIAKDKKREIASSKMPGSGDLISDEDVRVVMGQYFIPIAPEFRIRIARDFSKIASAKSGNRQNALVIG